MLPSNFSDCLLTTRWAGRAGHAETRLRNSLLFADPRRLPALAALQDVDRQSETEEAEDDQSSSPLPPPPPPATSKRSGKKQKKAAAKRKDGVEVDGGDAANAAAHREAEEDLDEILRELNLQVPSGC